ncbi:hypothetical protein O6B96_02355 [Campylobacter ureolyticus]|uniref:hypothetical protein n=1 Tax=Campylobacter ureolyticus TaxID=827 RepID=UPI0022B2B580|nr:hypothetical protein [Campylobacter ureolyticus]MCZ6149895.1 hypothetical protein [Campylobacter ureolyticus]
MGLFDNVFEKEVKYIKNLELIKKFRNLEIYIRFFERVYSPKSTKILAIRGTEFYNPFQATDNKKRGKARDLQADAYSLLDDIPKSQYTDMVKLINDNKGLLKGATVIGYSLGGTLTKTAAKSFPIIY